MRWKEKLYEHGEKRIIEKFAWFPINILDYQTRADETRWLEKVKIEQEYWNYGGDWGWTNLRFVN